MKLKLTRAELQALYELLQSMNSNFVCDDMDDKLLHTLLAAIFVKLHKTIIIHKKDYSIKLSEAEAMGFYISFERHNLGFSSFTGNLINQINSSINQKFAV